MTRRVAIALALVGSTSAARPATKPEAAALNHVYVVLDQASFDAIRTSPAVARLIGPADAGLPDYAPPAVGTDRLFLRGRSTYLELFAPKNRFDEPVGKVGIGLGADTAAGFERIAAGWRRTCGTGLGRETVHFRRVDPPVPWYESLACQATASGEALAMWAMLYRPEFARWQRGSDDENPPTERRAILGPRGAAGQGRFDLTALTLDLPPDLIARIGPQLAGAGMRARKGAHGETWIGDGWALTLRSSPAPPRLRAIVLTRHGADGGDGSGTVRLGMATLDHPRHRQVRFRFGEPVPQPRSTARSG